MKLNYVSFTLYQKYESIIIEIILVTFDIDIVIIDTLNLNSMQLKFKHFSFKKKDIL